MINIDDVQKAAQALNEAKKSKFELNSTTIRKRINKLDNFVFDIDRAIGEIDASGTKAALKLLKNEVDTLYKML